MQVARAGGTVKVRPWGLGLVSRCSIPLVSQIMSKRIGREEMVFLFRGGLANRMPPARVTRTKGVPMARSVRMM